MILPSYFDVNIYELRGGFHGFRLMLTQNPWFFPVFSRPNHSKASQELQRLRDGRAAFTKENVSAAVEQDGPFWGSHGLRGYPKVDGC